MGQQCCNPKNGYMPDQIPINIYTPESMDKGVQNSKYILEEVCQDIDNDEYNNNEVEDEHLPTDAMKLQEIPKLDNQRAESIRQQLGPIKLTYDPQYPVYQPIQIVNYKPNGDIHSIIIFEGQWYKQKRNGAGTQYYPDGSIYEGHWCHNKHDGFGRIIYADGEYYVGEWRLGQTHGEGTLVTKELTYTGIWEDDLQVSMFYIQNGQGYEKKSNGTTYEGSFKNGRKHGSGLVKYSDNSQYKGNFVEDRYDGIGEYKWSDGRTYGGEWKNNLMNGKGEMRYPNGDKYIGHFKNDKKHGLGKFIQATGRSIEGEWWEGKLNGEAKITEPTGESFQANFKNDQIV